MPINWHNKVCRSLALLVVVKRVLAVTREIKFGYRSFSAQSLTAEDELQLEPMENKQCTHIQQPASPELEQTCVPSNAHDASGNVL